MSYILIDKDQKKVPWLMRTLHSHPEYEVYYLINGKRTFFFSNQIHEITAPTLMVIPPYALHRTSGDRYERMNIYVSPKHLNSFQHHVLENKSMQILKPNENQHKEFQKLFNEFLNIKNNDYQDEIKDALFSYFILMLNKTNGLANDDTVCSDKKTSQLVLEIIEYFNNNHKQRLTLEELADKFFVSKATLNYSFKNVTTCSPMEYLLNIRINKAKELLTENKKTINEIANECGFSSPNYFGLIFKKKEGISPAAFRKIYH